MDFLGSTEHINDYHQPGYVCCTNSSTSPKMLLTSLFTGIKTHSAKQVLLLLILKYTLVRLPVNFGLSKIFNGILLLGMEY